MNKRIFIIHGWEGTPQTEWLPWAKKELEERGFTVFVPAMPDTNHPKIEAWVLHLASVVGHADKHTNFIGHSIGCQAIFRYLESLSEEETVGNVICVAPWFNLKDASFETDEDKKVADPWIKMPINFEKVKNKAVSFTAIFSKNDPYISVEENSRICAEKLGAEIIVVDNYGHFNDEFGIKELPLLLELPQLHGEKF